MDQRRFIAFVCLMVGVSIGWELLMQRMFPRRPKPPAEITADDDPLNAMGSGDSAGTVSALAPANRLAPAALGSAANPSETTAQEAEWKSFPLRAVTLGSTDPDSPFVSSVELTSRGAAVASIALNDRRYHSLEQKNELLRVVGNNPLTNARTFQTAINELDRQLLRFRESTATASWELIEDTLSDRQAEFRLTAPDGELQIVKSYRLEPLTAEQLKQPGIRDRNPQPYKLLLDITIKNLGSATKSVQYTLQGPVGLPLEDPENTSRFLQIRSSFVREDGQKVASSLLASAVIKQVANDSREVWKRPIHYLGVDGQYFAALARPLDREQAPGREQKSDKSQNSSSIDSSQPELMTKNPAFPDRSDVSVLMSSPTLNLAPSGQDGSSIRHQFELFAGPKRRELLDAAGASELLDYGWLSGLCNLLLWMMNSLHGLGLNYGWAIIVLTVCVRLALLPISKYNIAFAQKMKDLQPKLKDLEKKHGKGTPEYARAQMQVFADHGMSPAAGCLPMLVLFLQLPIFIALNWMLMYSIDLRSAQFLWIDNLAAPDQLFKLPFTVPWFGWTHFNLLPILSVAIFPLQQALTMPPPQNEEQAMQMKMMNVMMIAMGAMFYRLPAGVCLYFLCTSIWGISERLILDYLMKKYPPKPATAKAPSKPSWFAAKWNEMLEAAEKQAAASKQGTVVAPTPRKDRPGKR